jgi:ABC-2 type transport system permease protein
MTTLTDAMDKAPLESRVVAPAPLAPTRPLYWSLRRELWENRSLWIAPLVAAAVVLFGFSLSAIHLREHRFNAMALDPARRALVMTLPYDFAAMAVIFTGVIVGAFYCLGALHNERRDRSILFWKSLPVSDLTTVAAKAIIPLIVLPLIVLAVVLATLLVMLALSTVILIANGMDPATTWTHVPFARMPLVAAYGVAVLALWYAPIWGWLLLVGGWARRAPFLWAVLPPLALCVVERIAFNTSHVGSLLLYRLGGYTDAFTIRMHGKLPAEALPGLDPLAFVSTPGLWVGLAFAAAFLAAAVWLRRYREPV